MDLALFNSATNCRFLRIMHEVTGLLMYVHVQKSPLNVLALIFSLYHIPFVLQPTFYFHILSPFK